MNGSLTSEEAPEEGIDEHDNSVLCSVVGRLEHRVHPATPRHVDGNHPRPPRSWTPPQLADVVHDAEYYMLDAWHGEAWAVQDQDPDARLTALPSCDTAHSPASPAADRRSRPPASPVDVSQLPFDPMAFINKLPNREGAEFDREG